MRDIIEAELRGPSVFKDEGKLSYDYVPETLPGREEEMAKLARIFRPLLKSPSGQHVLVQGPVGTGKTALSKLFAKSFRDVAKTSSNLNVEWVDVNCRQKSTEAAALLKLLQHFDARFPDRGFSNAEMLDILRKNLNRRNAHLIVILDEADILLKKAGSDLVYNLTRFNEAAEKDVVGVSVVMVSQVDARKFLDEAAQSTFKRANTILLEKYGPEALLKIVHQRVDLAFHVGTVTDDVMDLVADTAAEYGDARYAIELLHKAGQNADDHGRSEVEPEDVRTAASTEHPFVTESRLRELERHKSLTLLAIARVLKKGEAYAKTGEIEERYALVCEEYGDRPRAHTQFWTYLKDLEGLGFIHARRSGKGVLGTTTLVSLPDVPAAELEKKLVTILGEPS